MPIIIFIYCSCDGICGRLFHPSSGTGTKSKCKTLELSEEEMVLVFYLIILIIIFGMVRSIL
jgi:hypothetical protein